MHDLIAFLRNRLDEDEMWARAACEGRHVPGEHVTLHGRWEPTDDDGLHWRWTSADNQVLTPEPSGGRLLDDQPTGFTDPSLRSREQFPTGVVGDLPQFAIGTAGEVASGAAGHIARHDPALVISDINSKRQILDDLLNEQHLSVEDCWYTCAVATEAHDGDSTCRDDAGDECDCGRDDRVSRRLRLLALPYAGHPDYRDEWSPTTTT